MSPVVRDGDVVTVSPLDGRLPKIGDVVAFLGDPSGGVVLHRAVAQVEGQWLVRGDNSEAPDGQIAPSELLGILVRVERDGRDVGLGWRLGWAFLGRTGLFRTVNFVRGMPRRAATSLVRWAQKRAAFRWMGRRLGPPVFVEEADARAIEEVARWQGEVSDSALRVAATGHARLGRRSAGVVHLVCQNASGHPFEGCWLVGLAVRPRYRGLGAGEALVRWCLERAASTGAAEVRLVVDAGNRVAIQLYERLGFEPWESPTLDDVLREQAKLIGGRSLSMRRRLR